MAMEFFKDTHEQLRNSYRHESGSYSASCTVVALDMAEELKKVGREPKIYVIRGEKIDTINRRQLIPSPYFGSIEWGAHIICVDRDVVYDPMIQVPLSLDEYIATAFYDQDVELEDCSCVLDR